MKKQRILSMLLVIAMVLSLLPVISSAAEATAGARIELEDIQAGAPVAITMTKDSKTYALPVVGEGGKKQPLAIPATVDGDSVTIEADKADVSWNIVAVTGGYNIVNAAGNYLYVTADNNGVRIGKPNDMAYALWNVIDGYLTAPDSKGNTRYMGVYQGETPDWRCYNSNTTNVAGQVVAFWSLDGNIEPPVPTVSTPTASVPSGMVEKGTSVALSCKTEGATIYYHTGDGKWTEYTQAFVVNEALNIVAYAVKEGMKDSKELKVSYTVFDGINAASLVTDMSQLRSGDQIIIVAQGYNYTIGTNQKSNNRDIAEIVKNGNIVTFQADAQIFTLEAGTTDDTYALYTANGNAGYLYAPSDSGNYLRTSEDKGDSGSFFISIAADGTATIRANTSKAQNTMYYNTSKLFSCYDPGKPQKPICIYKIAGQNWPGLPAEGDTVTLYNLSARGLLSSVNSSSTAIQTVSATLSEGKATGSNGSFLFRVEKNGAYYRFYNASFGYLSTEGTKALYTATASESCDFTVEEFNGGYKLLSREGKELQALDRKVAPKSEEKDRDTLTFHFFPCANDVITDGIVNLPEIVFGNPAPAYAGQDYLLNFSVNAVFGVKELSVTLGNTALDLREAYGRYSATVPASLISGSELVITVKGQDQKGVVLESSVTITVKDEPMISNMQPAANTQTKENKRPVISANVANAGENPTVTLTVNGQEVKATYADGTVTYTPSADLAEGRTLVVLTVTRADGKTATKKWSFTVGEAKYTLLFGQLHSHTGEYSDGSGTLTSALEYIAALPEDAKVDFVAFTDHSNYFDTSDAPNPEEALFDLSLATPESAKKWTTYKNTMALFNTAHAGKILAIPGFEMTWSGGPGHMNTFVTEGIVSRNNKTLNNKSADAGMRAYYELLTRDEGEDGITQLNHPGSTFGNFTDFSYWTPEADARVYLVEVGNGEGPIPSAGYFPSYEQYTLALDKGWHVAPTNNQDNHKGLWGNANEGRDVVLAEDFSEEAIYDAIRNYRVYATEDRNLEIGYTVNELPMGTIMENVPETLQFAVTLKDPDATDAISSVELIVNSGKVAYAWTDAEELASGILSVELEPDYSYYYLRVTQADKDLAVTAPVWVGDSLRLGIREAVIDADVAVVGEELTIKTTFYNEEMADAIVKNIVYTIDGSEVLYVDNEVHLLSAGTEEVLSWKYTPKAAKLSTINITAIVEYDGKEYTFTASVTVDPTDKVVYMGIDASHLNEYVSGKYSQMMENFTAMAQDVNIRTKQLNNSEALISACNNENYVAIILNVPSRQMVQAKTYSNEELQALVAFRDRGGILIISNMGDKGDKLTPHMAETQNALLEALGSSLRFYDDAVKDGSYNGVYASTFGSDPIAEGLEEAVYYYNGSSVYAVDAQGNTLSTLPATVSPVLFGNANSSSNDDDADGIGGASAVKYSFTDKNGVSQSRLLLMAAERVEGKGMIFVSGVPFMNDYNVTIPAEYGNNALAVNLLNAVNPMRITPIAEVRKQTEVGYKYNIEGIVTSNASGYDKDTAFFDCIYVQDETAGINCFPVAGEYKIGDIVRIQGSTEFYIGEPELQVQVIEKIGETEAPTPLEITARQLNTRSVEGMLITLKGRVTNFTTANGLVDSIYIKDENGEVGRAFIDGYITSAKEIANLSVGSYISVTGLASYDNTYAILHGNYARIRVRDRDDIVAQAHTHVYENGLCECGAIDDSAIKVPFTDVDGLNWFDPAIRYDFAFGLMNGMSQTAFGPETTLTRGMIVTILHRIAGTPEPQNDCVFEDIHPEAYYAAAVTWGYENGIVMGKTQTSFDPEAPVTREQMVTFLYRFAVYMGCEVGVAEATDISGFVDDHILYDYSKAPFAWAVGTGLVNGMGHNNLEPQGTATRAQVAQLIMKYHRMLNGT